MWLVKRVGGSLALWVLLFSWGAYGIQPAGFDWKAAGRQLEQLYGEQAGRRLRAWQRLMGEANRLSESQQLTRINQFFNQLQFLDDIDLWGETDYWATPLEFLGANGGDCEDFSIAKYMSLLNLGVDPDKLRLIYVKSLTLNQFHMVVAYYPNKRSVPLILDNIDGEIKTADLRKDLVPVYSFNGRNLWLNKERGRGVLTGKASRLKRWNDLRSRYRLQSLRKPKFPLE
ncbi:MAG: transglutaminase-like cysteine peptidase [Motiliproteus sp.]|nr:transglutaminase-like cysteine peptidase [Motiliproteus sp.]MCW9052475.1 transglutaminase-like cysteine peptidase [Motiliproteus sp.]